MNEGAVVETAIAVVEDDAVVLSQIVRALELWPSVHPYNNLEDVLKTRSDTFRHLVLVLGPSLAEQSVFDQVGELVRLEPGYGALLVVDTPDNAVLRSALRAGLDDVISLERIGVDLVAAILELERRLREATVELRPPPISTIPAPRGHVVSLFSPKGGVGRSVVAVNLAVAFAERTRRRVVLIDTDPQFGDVAMMLRLNPIHTLVDAVAAGDRLDPSLLESLFTHDERSGVDVLAAATDPTVPAKFTPKAISRVIEVLREMGAIVVIDTARSLDDVVLQVLSESDDIVYLVGMDVPSVKNARLGLQALEVVQIPLSHVLVVLNRADSRVQLSPRDVEKVLEMKLDISLPSDVVVPKSVNRGVPAVLSEERSRFTSHIYEMAELLLSRATAKAAS